MPGAEGDLELLAEEQVLDDEALTAADGGDQGSQDEPDEFEHRGRIVDHDSRQDRRTDFATLQARSPAAVRSAVHGQHSSEARMSTLAQN